MGLSCKKIQSLIPPAVEGELDESLRASIQDHTYTCPECQSALRIQEAIASELKAEPLRSPPPVYFEGVLEAIHQQMPVVAPRLGASRRRRLSRPAAASLFVYSLLFLSFLSSALQVNWPDFRLLEIKREYLAFESRQERSVILSRDIAFSGVWVQGLGFVPGSANLIKMSERQLAEYGITKKRTRSDRVIYEIKG